MNMAIMKVVRNGETTELSNCKCERRKGRKESRIIDGFDLNYWVDGVLFDNMGKEV